MYMFSDNTIHLIQIITGHQKNYSVYILITSAKILLSRLENCLQKNLGQWEIEHCRSRLKLPISL